MALVLQEPIILPTTVAENIAYGKPGASMAEIEAAAHAAHADELIERLPQHYQTVVGDGGARLSVGEKQRINLARAFLKNAPILLMDEPTTHLDMPSIDALISALEQYEGTLIFISHDVYFIKAIGNRVVHVDAGRLTHYAGDYQYYLDKTSATSARAGTCRAGSAPKYLSTFANTSSGATSPTIPITALFGP